MACPFLRAIANFVIRRHHCFAVARNKTPGKSDPDEGGLRNMRLALRLLISPTTWFAGLLLIDFLFTHFRSTPGSSEETTFFSAFFVFAIAVAWGAVADPA